MGALVLPRDECLGTEEGEGREIEGREQEKPDTTDEEHQDRRHAYRNDHPQARLGGSTHQPSAAMAASSPAKRKVGKG
jgi:hypothetical protein